MRLPNNKTSAQIRDMADKALALWIAGDKTHIESARANAASSAPIQQLYRQAIAQERASGGPSIAAPADQAAPDVGFKRKADEESQIYDWQNDERAFEVMVKQFQKNEDAKTKAEAEVIAADSDIKKAEAVVVKTKGVAESKVILADADIKKAEAHAIRLGAAGKKRIDDAEAHKIEAEAMLLEFELAQKRKAAGLDTDAKKSKAEEKKEERRLALNAKRRESRAQANAAKDKSPTPPQGTA